MSESYVSEQSYFFQASSREVYRALVDPKALKSWFLSEARVSPTAGGAFTFEWIGGYRMESKILSLTPDTAVTFLWKDAQPDGRSVLTEAAFTIESKGKGTLLKLRHSGFTSPQHYAECASRWAYYLTNLKSVLDHGVDLRSPDDW